MATPENEKQLFADLAKGYKISTTKSNQAIGKAYQDASDRINSTTPPPVVTPPPTTGAWPKDLSANPTGPKGTPTLTGGLEVTADRTINNFDVSYINIAPGKSLTGTQGRIKGDGTRDGIQYNNYTLKNVEVTNTFDGGKAHGNISVDSCWFHDYVYRTGAGTGAGNYTHNDFLQIGNGSNIKIINSRFENKEGVQGNSGIYLNPDNGPIDGVLIENNYINNVGNVMLSVQPSVNNPGSGKPKNVTVRNNIFGKQPDYIFNELKWSGYFYAWFIMDEGLIFENNKYVDQSTGELKPLKLTNTGPSYLGGQWNNATKWIAVPA